MKLQQKTNWERWRAETRWYKEPETIEWIKNMVPGKWFWDVGANIGVFSVFAASRGLKVYSFEPDLKNYTALVDNMSLNKFPNYNVLNVAFWDYCGKVRFSHRAEAGMTGGRVGEGEGSIYAIRGDTILEDCDYLKIDTDGGEYRVLLGMGDKLYKVREVLIEINENFFEICRLLRKYGFRERIGFQKFKTRQHANNYIFGRKWR